MIYWFCEDCVIHNVERIDSVSDNLVFCCRKCGKEYIIRFIKMEDIMESLEKKDDIVEILNTGFDNILRELESADLR